MPIYMKIEKGTAKNKKWKAVFSHYVDKKLKIIKTTQFGDNRYEDYTQHKTKTDEKHTERDIKKTLKG
jgi:hypothetical protein